MAENSAILKPFNVSKEIFVWFVKIFLFVRMCSVYDSTHFHEHSRRNCPTCNYDSSTESWFVKYYVVLSESTLQLESVDLALSYHWLQGQNALEYWVISNVHQNLAWGKLIVFADEFILIEHIWLFSQLL